jgi:hypothetical protein
MDAKFWPQLSLTMLVISIVIAGLITVGGPEAGRVEKRDDQRYRELQDVRRQLDCLARAGGESLPAEIIETETCSSALSEGALLLSEGYRYLPQDDGNYLLCATFEDIDKLRQRYLRGEIDSGGCINGTIN